MEFFFSYFHCTWFKNTPPRVWVSQMGSRVSFFFLWTPVLCVLFLGRAQPKVDRGCANKVLQRFHVSGEILSSSCKARPPHGIAHRVSHRPYKAPPLPWYGVAPRYIGSTISVPQQRRNTNLGPSVHHPMFTPASASQVSERLAPPSMVTAHRNQKRPPPPPRRESLSCLWGKRWPHTCRRYGLLTWKPLA